jgi:hypothetical protein
MYLSTDIERWESCHEPTDVRGSISSSDGGSSLHRRIHQLRLVHVLLPVCVSRRTLGQLGRRRT